MCSEGFFTVKVFVILWKILKNETVENKKAKSLLFHEFYMGFFLSCYDYVTCLAFAL